MDGTFPIVMVQGRGGGGGGVERQHVPFKWFQVIVCLAKINIIIIIQIGNVAL